MPELRIPIDPTNPGQFYACCGLFELYEMYKSGGLAWFETDHRLPHRAKFILATPAEAGVERLLADLRACQFTPIGDDEPTIAPVRFAWAGREFVLNWWLNDKNTEKVPLKLWAGQQKSAGNLNRLVAALPADCSTETFFDLTQYTTTRLGVDPRSAWNKLDCGYSPNEREVKEARTAPLVDLLAAVGLQGFRPDRDRARSAYVYALWGVPLPRAAARGAAVGAWQVVPQRLYQFHLVDRGQSYMGFDFGKERQDTSR